MDLFGTVRLSGCGVARTEVNDLLADVVADGEEENKVTVDAEKLCFVNGG